MCLVPPLAAASCAVLALLLTELCIRFALTDLRPIAATMQVLAVLTYLFGIHTNSENGAGSFLQNDWRAMGAAIVIALSVLFNAGRYMLRHKRSAEAQGVAAQWSWINQLAMLVGFGLLHLSMLFAIDLAQAAALWPFTACLVLSLALWMSHGALAAFALVLQVISAMLYLLHSPVITSGTFAHLGFATPLALALAGWWSADRMQREAKRYSDFSTRALASAADPSNPARPWLNPWCNLGSVSWGVPIWALAWWFVAWIGESDFALVNAHLSALQPTVTVFIAIASSIILLSLAHWRKHEQAGGLSALSLPFYLASLIMGVHSTMTTGSSLSPYLPSAALGWAAWPLALAWFYFSLKRQAIFFVNFQSLYKLMHVVGLWFFVLLASMELRAQVLMHIDASVAEHSSWLHLAWVLAPALCLYQLTRPALNQRWPLTSYRVSYLETAGAPIALYLLLW